MYTSSSPTGGGATTTPSSQPQSKAVGSYILRGRPASSNNSLSQSQTSQHPPLIPAPRRAVSTDGCMEIPTSTSSSGNNTAMITHPPPPTSRHHLNSSPLSPHNLTSSTSSSPPSRKGDALLMRVSAFGAPVVVAPSQSPLVPPLAPLSPSGPTSARGAAHCRPLSTDLLLSPLYPPNSSGGNNNNNNITGGGRKRRNLSISSAISSAPNSSLHQSRLQSNSPVTSMISTPDSNTEPFDENGVNTDRCQEN